MREEKEMAMKDLSKQEIEARMNQQKILLVPNTGAPQRDGLKTCLYNARLKKEEKGNSHWGRLSTWKQQNLHQLRICSN